MEKSNLVSHAERELKLAGMFDKDADYGGALAKSIVKVVEEFSKQEYSGASAGIAIEALGKLLKFETLTPITDDRDEWMEVENGIWQSKRNPAIFSKNGGKDWYNINS